MVARAIETEKLYWATLNLSARAPDDRLNTLSERIKNVVTVTASKLILVLADNQSKLIHIRLVKKHWKEEKKQSRLLVSPASFSS